MDGILIIVKTENGPRASSAPALGLNTIIFKRVYWYMQQISGERLQDHWSSGLLCEAKFFFFTIIHVYRHNVWSLSDIVMPQTLNILSYLLFSLPEEGLVLLQNIFSKLVHSVRKETLSRDCYDTMQAYFILRISCFSDILLQ